MLVHLLTLSAFAGWPDTPSLSSMTEHDGVVVADGGVLSADYRELVAELGTAIANPADLSASTTGTYGFEFGLGSTFVFTTAKQRDSKISPWDRATPSEKPESYLYIPTLSFRKGLPMSTEIGGSIGWIGQTNTGKVSGFGRIALLEGYKPLPDLTLQVGYSGYVGNDELELGVLELGVTLGGKLWIPEIAGVNSGSFEPFVNFTLLQVSALPTADLAVIQAIGATSFRAGDSSGLLVIPRISGGFQVTSGVVYFKLSGSWAWATLPAATAGMGVRF